MMDYKAEHRIRTRAWAVELLGGACVRCGIAEQLQFDHVIPGSKCFEISAGIRDGYSRARLLVELAKCQLLCRDHHREKSLVAGELPGGENKIHDRRHGTSVRYADRCRCFVCREWKRLYRAKLVDSLGNPVSVV